ncbi:MAG: hypothetical protein ACOX9C_07220 [Kiritimatiellia bacterium]
MLAFVALAIVSISGCKTPEPPQEGKLYIQTLIDGRDSLYIRGDSMWYVHHSYQLPGMWAGDNLPTYINKEQEWNHIWNRNISDVVRIEDPETALPTAGEWNSENMKVKFYTTGFGEYEVKEYPGKANDYTLVIDLNDTEPLGAHWYVIDIDWDEGNVPADASAGN